LLQGFLHSFAIRTELVVLIEDGLNRHEVVEVAIFDESANLTHLGGVFAVAVQVHSEYDRIQVSEELRPHLGDRCLPTFLLAVNDETDGEQDVPQEMVDQ